jgi:polyhydroxyalkanoate synthase
VFKIHLLADTEVTFLLATGGHNSGIVSAPGKAASGFRVLTKAAEDRYLDPDTWLTMAPRTEGSWWTTWVSWLAERSEPATAAPPLGAPNAGYPPLGDAPGSYVKQP